MSTDETVIRYEFTAEGMYYPPKRSRWRRLVDWLLRRPAPKPVQPPGTFPLTYDTVDPDTGMRTRVYIPAARPVLPADAKETP